MVKADYGSNEYPFEWWMGDGVLVFEQVFGDLTGFFFSNLMRFQVCSYLIQY